MTAEGALNVCSAWLPQKAGAGVFSGGKRKKAIVDERGEEEERGRRRENCCISISQNTISLMCNFISLNNNISFHFGFAICEMIAVF